MQTLINFAENNDILSKNDSINNFIEDASDGEEIDSFLSEITDEDLTINSEKKLKINFQNDEIKDKKINHKPKRNLVSHNQHFFDIVLEDPKVFREAKKPEIVDVKIAKPVKPRKNTYQRRKVITEEMVNGMREMLQLKFKRKDIAARYGICTSTLKKYVG